MSRAIPVYLRGSANGWPGQLVICWKAPCRRKSPSERMRRCYPPDPADRFLAATAQVLGLTLVTADERLLGLGEIATLANR